MSASRLLFMGALAALAASGCARKEQVSASRAGPQAQPVEVTRVTRQDLTETLNLVGSVAANESATIRPEISGLVRSIHFEEGQQVKKGDLLVKIDDAELRAQLAQSEALYRLAELNLQRAEKLTESQSNSVAELDRNRSEYSSAKSNLDLIKVRLDRTDVRAPFDGVVGARTLSPGDYVNSQSVITTIDDLSRLKIDFQVPERFVAKVRAGTPFVVRSQALGQGRTLTGEVYFTASVVDRATRSSEVKGFITGTAEGLKPGMFTNIDVVLDVREGVLTVPEGAIFTTTAGAQIVVVKEEGGVATADFVRVKTGLRARGQVEVSPITGQLTEATQVVASGVGALILFPGARLEVRPAITGFQTASSQP